MQTSTYNLMQMSQPVDLGLMDRIATKSVRMDHMVTYAAQTVNAL